MAAPDQIRDASYQRQIRTFTRSAIVDKFAVSPDHSDGGTSIRRPGECAHVAAVISTPDLGVFAVAAGGVSCAFCCVVDALSEHCLRRRARTTPLVAAVLELSGYYVNAVQLHVHAADVLVRCGVDGEGFR